MNEPTSASHVVHFRDARPPQAIQHELERRVMARLTPAMEDQRLVHRGTVAVNGATCAVELTFEAAWAHEYGYRLHFEMTWDDATPEHADYHRKVAPSWMELWAQDFVPAERALPGEGVAELYAGRVSEAMVAERALSSISAVEQEILAAVRAGGTFSTSHKEGGTTVSWRGGRFVRADYGESQFSETFVDDAAFLSFLRRFFEWETRRGSRGTPTELQRWQLIYRLLRPAAGEPGSAPGAARRELPLGVVLVALAASAFAVGAVLWTPSTLPTARPPVKVDTFDGRPPQVRPPAPAKWTR